MKKSEHNIFTKINDTTWLLANPLSGHADLLSRKEADAYEKGTLDPDYLSARGFLVDPAEEAAKFKAAYLQFIKDRESDEIQIFYVPSYACNFACAYCYQEQYQNNAAKDDAVMDAFFRYVDTAFAGREKYLTLFGGEPLLPGHGQQAKIARFLSLAGERSLETAVVTNGYHLLDYLGILESAAIREVQVTLDGLAETHDRRRPLKSGKGGTFDRIVAGVDALLDASIDVNLRLVLDKDNIDQLPLLADFAEQRGWTGHPRFKTQLGRNYELHHCSRVQSTLYDRLEMYKAVAALMARHPHIAAFHKPNFHLARLLDESATLPPPNFDACPGGKTEWAFDYTGRIYSCTATVGKTGEALGTFYPEVKLDDDAVFEWQDRDVLAIEKCETCNVRLVCGGGCGSLAKNQHGSLHSPDCRPVEAVTALGAALYRISEKQSE